MPKKLKIRRISLGVREGTFSNIFKRFADEKKEYDLSDFSKLKRLFSNEKAKILHILKTQEIDSIYHLAKVLKRDFKSVRQDVAILKEFGFINIQKKYKGKRRQSKPVLAVDELEISIHF